MLFRYLVVSYSMKNALEALKTQLAKDIAFYVKEHDLDKAEQLSRILGNLLTSPTDVVK